MAHLYLAAPQKSSGKTTVAVGLCRALRDRGLHVQPFKKGPDYIDPFWLTQAAGHSCCNLDFHTMAPEEILAFFAHESAAADLAVLEGNMGLYDTIAPDGSHSNAELAKQLHAPVVLVINCEGMTRGIAPLLMGYLAFDPQVRIAGVVLNRVGGGRHGSNLTRYVEQYTDVPVLGVLPREGSIVLAQRHLGLIPAHECAVAQERIAAIARFVAAHLDLERMLEIAESAPRPDCPVPPESASPAAPATHLRIGIARDAAFGFYYPEDLRALACAGAELVPFSPLADAQLPRVDALFIGGGFPECHMAELEANRTLRQQIAGFIADGAPVYAECGGLMYLCEHLHWGTEQRAMVGALHAGVAMHEAAQGRGYMRLRETECFPWPMPGHSRELPAHEFHHSAVIEPDSHWQYGYEVLRGTGVDGRHDGIVQGNLFASYSHLRGVGGNCWPERFVRHIERVLSA